MGAGVGEEVNPGVARSFNKLTTDILNRIRGQGLSDQRIALIDRILASRRSKQEVSAEELAKGLEESRSVRDVQESKDFKKFVEQGLSRVEAGKKARSAGKITIAESRAGQKLIEQGVTQEDIDVLRRKGIDVFGRKTLEKLSKQDIKAFETTRPLREVGFKSVKDLTQENLAKLSPSDLSILEKGGFISTSTKRQATIESLVQEKQIQNLLDRGGQVSFTTTPSGVISDIQEQPPTRGEKVVSAISTLGLLQQPPPLLVSTLTSEFVTTPSKSLQEITQLTIDTKGIKGSIIGGAELAKFAIFSPFKGIGEEFISTGEEIKTDKSVPIKFRTPLGVTLGVVGRLVPTTPLEIGFISGGGKAIKEIIRFSPTLGKITSVSVGTGLGLPTLIDKDSIIEERIAGGVIVGGGVAGGLLIPSKFQVGIKQQQAQLGALQKRDILTFEEAEALGAGINLQSFLRGQKDVPVVKGFPDIFPPELKIGERAVVEKFISTKDPLLFGGKSLEIRDIRPSSDIDVAIIDNRKALLNVLGELQKTSPGEIVRAGEAIGIRGEKLLDIKDIARLEEFAFSQKPILTTEGLKVTPTSEQFSRALSGTLELRKGGKDIADVLFSAEAILKQARINVEQTTLPGLRQFRQFKLARAERQFVQLQSVLPKIKLLIERTGAEGFKFEPPKLTSVVAFPEAIDIFPPGKRAIGGFGLPIERPLKLVPTPRTTLAPPSLRRGTGVTPSLPKARDIASSIKFKPLDRGSRFFGLPSTIGGGIAPSQVPSLGLPTPSEFTPFGIPTDPFITTPPTRRPDPSRFLSPPTTPFFPGTPPPPPPGRPGDPFDILQPTPPPKRRKSEDKKLKKGKVKKKKRRLTPLAPSFTAIALDARGAFPKAGRRIGISPRDIRLLPR